MALHAIIFIFSFLIFFLHWFWPYTWMFLWLSFQNFQPRLRCIWSEAVQRVCSIVNYVNIRLKLRETLPDTLNQDIWICNTLATIATRSWKQNEVSNNIWEPVILINTMQLTFNLSYSNLRHKVIYFIENL